MNDLDHYAFIFGCAYAEACGKDPGDDVALLGQADRAGLAAVIEEVRKERPTEADQRDAARYRWLRAYDGDDGERIFIGMPKRDSYGNWKDDVLMDDEADAAIDAAMRSSASEGKE